MRELNAKLPQQSADFPDSFYRIVVKGALVKEGKVFLCEDASIINRPPHWELPGGGLDFGESVSDALKREVKEEIGLAVTWVAETPLYVWTERIEHTRGMDWWYALVLVFQFEVENLDAFVPSDECRNFKFFSKEELEVLPEKHQRLQDFVNHFNPTDFIRTSA